MYEAPNELKRLYRKYSRSDRGPQLCSYAESERGQGTVWDPFHAILRAFMAE